jgi:Pyruvate/2-oxoglutarate dehydrogenase complex, dihydrolipoamide acyltransferase (E2) component, and related enzymes
MSDQFVVLMPDIGEGVVEGEVIEWLKSPGDQLKRDEPVVVVMTDKATVELPSPHAGILKKTHYKVGEMAIKGKPLYEIETDSPVVSKQAKSELAQAATSKGLSQQKNNSCSASTSTLATPATRQLAKQLNISLDQLSGTGPEGRITDDDVRKAFLNLKPAVENHLIQHALPGDKIEKLSGIRLKMAETMVKTHQHIPQFSYFQEVDLTALVKLREELKPQFALKNLALSFMPFILKALSKAFKIVPYANASLNMDTREIYVHPDHNIGFAINSPQGLVVPVLHQVNKLTFDEVAIQYEALKARALEGALTREELIHGTFTLSNFGVLGGEAGTPVIRFPESGILGLGKAEMRPRVIEGLIVPRQMMTLCWSFDHRLLEGSEGALLSKSVKEALENPKTLL